MKLLNKTFFKFAFGFIAIIFVSLFFARAIQYYDNAQADEIITTPVGNSD